MSHGILVLLLVLGLVGCSTRSVVVKPEEVSRLDDPQWTITSPPVGHPR
jgi:hypothetical protein